MISYPKENMYLAERNILYDLAPQYNKVCCYTKLQVVLISNQISNLLFQTLRATEKNLMVLSLLLQ